jgi:deaminated glutathione amidase
MKLRVASCQFPVTEDIGRNARYVRRFMKKAAGAGAHVLHTSEACLSGYAGTDFASFDGYAWDVLREETSRCRELASELELWLILGSTHFLDDQIKPTNCLYIIDPKGKIADRYDKCMCTKGDQRFYSAGNRLVTRTIRGVKVGFAICYDVCYPQLYAAYRMKTVKLMLHSFYNAHHDRKNCLDVLNVRQLPTRCADNLLWAVANNSCNPYSHWGTFVARPDATIPKQLGKNRPGMLIHEFPDELSEGGWIHNLMPMKLASGERLHFGTPSNHPRQKDGKSEP